MRTLFDEINNSTLINTHNLRAPEIGKQSTISNTNKNSAEFHQLLVLPSKHNKSN